MKAKYAVAATNNMPQIIERWTNWTRQDLAAEHISLHRIELNCNDPKETRTGASLYCIQGKFAPMMRVYTSTKGNSHQCGGGGIQYACEFAGSVYNDYFFHRIFSKPLWENLKIFDSDCLKYFPFQFSELSYNESISGNISEEGFCLEDIFE
uniref:Uncharacterized protein n=1 Tax=Megaselia scalaris TaxID=36166 RepID=T1GEC6_MEGSC